MTDTNSVVTVLSSQNGSDVVTKRFTKSNWVLETDISDMASENWTDNVEVYTKTMNHESLHFDYVSSVTLILEWDFVWQR